MQMLLHSPAGGCQLASGGAGARDEAIAGIGAAANVVGGLSIVVFHALRFADFGATTGCDVSSNATRDL